MINATMLMEERLALWLRERFGAVAPECQERCPERCGAVRVVPSTNPQFGDYQCNDAMGIAKALKMNPQEFARQVIDVEAPPFIAKLEVAGPGFINITLSNGGIASTLRTLAADPHLGIAQRGAGRTVVIDYSSPNVAKPMHIGHIRSTVIGSALDHLYRAMGYRVIADNHIGDWGTQFGIIIMGYRHFLDKERLVESPIEELERIYVQSYGKAKEDEAWMEACRAELVKLQAGDPGNLALWQEFIRLSLCEFDRIYERLGVRFDLTRGESHYNAALPGVIERLQAAGLAEESEGALVVNLDAEGLGVAIVRKRDGAYNYATTDIATVLSRVDEFAPEKIIYVTDERQQLHFKQFFTVCRKLGVPETTQLEHVWFGLMRLPEGTFSTRQGNVIKLDALLDEAETRAGRILMETRPDLSEEETQRLERAIGISAVKYADLSQNPQTLVTFSWEKAMALDGNSGPYLQYAYARIRSVRDKFKEAFPDANADAAPLHLDTAIERSLALKLLQYPSAVTAAADACKPSTLADYLFGLAQAYSAFYQQLPFIKAEPGVRESRIRLCGIVAAVLKDGLTILGIATPERI
ncbi:MAG: arginine--tRNA ligase [Kiritimatiellaeota bacterium]|nr:arginine--tRNA ligase [Kiritimatiellota bacterium]